MKPYEFSIISGGIQHANFIPFIGAALGGLVSEAAGLVSGAASLAGPAISGIGGALGSTAGFLGETAIGAGGSVLGGIGKLGGAVKGAGTALFGGVPTTTAGLFEPSGASAVSDAWLSGAGMPGTPAAGGLFGNLSWDTIGNVASLGYSIYQSAEERKLMEKAIEAQRGAGYFVTAPGAPPTTTLAPTTSVVMPAAAAPGQPPGLFQTEEGAKMIKYAIIAIVAYLLFKGVK